MAKTDKELAVELATTIISSWNANQYAKPLQSNDAINIFNNAYKAIHEKDDTK